MSTTEEPRDGIPVAEAYRLMHGLNQDIKFGKTGMNALETVRFLESKGPDYKKVHAKIDEFQKEYESPFFREWRALGWIIAAVGLIYLGDWYRWAGWAIVALVLMQTSKWVGVREGYLHGYEAAREEAFTEMLELSEEEQKDLYSRAAEMEMDERIVDRLDRPK